jgi:hypothetical protein
VADVVQKCCRDQEIIGPFGTSKSGALKSMTALTNFFVVELVTQALIEPQHLRN